MTDELMKRLRAYNDESFVETLCGEAADRIEALTAQLESTLKDRAKIIADLNMARWARDVAVDAANATVRKLATAEAERDRLREALNQSRLAFAGLVSVQSAIDLLDSAALKGGTP